MALDDLRYTGGVSGGRRTGGAGYQAIGRDRIGSIYGATGGTVGVSGAGGLRVGPSRPSTFRQDLATGTRRLNQGYAGVRQARPQQQWVPQQIKSSTTTSTRAIGALPDLPEYEELDEDKVRSRTQEFSALGRRTAKSNFQDLLSRIYGATPGDPYAKDLARKASQGFSIDTQRAISAGGRQALTAGLQEQQQRNARRMTAYSAAVNAVLSSATTTAKRTNEYGPVPYQSTPRNVNPTTSQRALSTRYNNQTPLSVGQPYTYG